MNQILTPVLFVLVVGLLAGIILAIAAKYMAVEVNETAQNIREMLPGANCGACGCAGCDEYAEKLANGTAATNLCIPGGKNVVNQISSYLGLSGGDIEEQVAVVRCSGIRDKTPYVMDYKGLGTCEANNTFYQGRGSCSYACLGFGDCVSVCKYGAMNVIDGVAVVDRDACVGCTLCAAACPNDLITMVPKSSEIFVGCSSHDKGAYTRKICLAGCIGCKKCERECEFGAITIEDSLAVIDPNKCTNCGACMAVCPSQVIKKEHISPNTMAV